MHRDSTSISPVESIPVRQGIITLRGYELVVSVEHGRLSVKDGLATRWRKNRFTKATCGIERLILLGHSGVVTLEALRWLHDIGAAVVYIDADGNLLLASAPFKETHSQLRRSQALANRNKTGIAIARHLLEQKLRGQAEFTVKRSRNEDASSILSLCDDLAEVDQMERFRIVESRAAAIYWSVWADVEICFARRYVGKIPSHWQTFGQRISPLTGSPRNAANPANAILNYLYAILEAETRIALLIVGLDPALGLLHADQSNRDSLALDVMEAIRPGVDAWLFDFLSRNTFAKCDFFERRDGTVRISSRVTGMLAETAPIWAREVGPVAEWVAKEMNRSANRKGRPLPTPLTEANRSAGREKYRRTHDAKRSQHVVRLVKTCPQCGKIFRESGKKFCSKGCWKKHNKEVVVPRLAEAGPENLARLREEGRDPSHGGGAGRKRGRSNAHRAKERAEWVTNHTGMDPDHEKNRFKDEILPRLNEFTLSEIMQATGLSKRYVSIIRKGQYTPHPMHHESFKDLISGRN
jgi:CRISPR-associated endonuclease Cas1